MTIIAERVLTLLESEGGKHSVPARIHAPREDDGCWLCDVEIAWPRGTKRLAAGGVDAVQALFCGMQIIGTWLYVSEDIRRASSILKGPEVDTDFPFLGA